MKIIALAALLAIAAPAAALAEEPPQKHQPGRKAAEGGTSADVKTRTPPASESREPARDGGKIIYF
jgi:hypothetical protein